MVKSVQACPARVGHTQVKNQNGQNILCRKHLNSFVIRKMHFKFYKILCLLESICKLKMRFSNYRSIQMENVG